MRASTVALSASAAVWAGSVGLLHAAAAASEPPGAGTKAEVRFAARPQAGRADGTVKIAFAVSAPTDVEVTVLDAKGEAVRHLAAGVLGGRQPPPAPLKPGLSQAIEWDRKDDLGKAVGADLSSLKVRVRAGTAARFAGFIGGDPCTFGGIAGLATDEEGYVYVLGFQGSLNQGHMSLRVFDPEGRYVREVLPFPADLKPDDMKDVARWDEQRQSFRPRHLKNLNPGFYEGGRGTCLSLVSASRRNGVLFTDGAGLFALEASGAVRGERFLSRVMWPKKQIPWGNVPNSGGGPLHLAISPDGKYAYLAGPFTCKTRYGHTLDADFPPGRVFRMSLESAAPEYMKEFVTIEVEHKDGVGGKWTEGMGYEFSPNGPVQGVTVDAKGRVYLCDREHARVAVFDEAGKLIDELAVEYPAQVAVHPRTGAIYVMQKDRKSYSAFHAKLIKFSRLGKGEGPTATYQFDPGARDPRMALAVGEGKTKVWVSGVKGGLVALEDRGASFEPIPTHFKPAPEAQLDWNRLAVDYERDIVYVNDGAALMYRYDGQTGQGGLLKKDGKPFWATDLAVGYDGLLFVRKGQGLQPGTDYSGPLERYTRELEPAPYPESGTHVLSKYIYSRYGIGYAERGIGAGPDGKVYISWMYSGWVKYAITGFGPDGSPLKGKYLKGECHEANYKAGTPPQLDSAVIGPITAANGGIRVDLDGNIYVGMRVWPKGLPLPEGFQKDDAYQWTVGSVVKFTPQGGAISCQGEGWGSDPFGGRPRTPGAAGIEMVLLPRKLEMFVEGAVAAYPGLGPFSHAGFGGNTCCVCRAPRFDLDRYGRLALPNPITASVLLVDNAGNTIAEIGRYGNLDSQLLSPSAAGGDEPGKPIVAVPDIPLAWPSGAGFGRKYLYVNDTQNRRVVRVSLTHALEETCPIR